jgi:hypothetical protein
MRRVIPFRDEFSGHASPVTGAAMNAGWNSYLGETDPKTISMDDLGPLAFGGKATEGAYDPEFLKRLRNGE